MRVVRGEGGGGGALGSWRALGVGEPASGDGDRRFRRWRRDAPDVARVAAAITAYGFPAEVVDASGLAFRVGGMVCASCPPRIERAIGRLRGVEKVEANLLLGKVVVRYNAAAVGARTIMRAIEALEYAAELWEETDGGPRDSRSHANEALKYRREFFVSAAFAFPLFFLMMVLDRVPAVHEAMMTDALGGAASPGALPAMALGARRWRRPCSSAWAGSSYVRAWRAVKHGGANMDLLVAMGTSAAYAYSAYVVVAGVAAPGLARGDAHFFETSAVLISFVLMGKWLEARAKGKTSDAIRALAALQPAAAVIVEMGPDMSARAAALADRAARAPRTKAAALAAAAATTRRTRSGRRGRGTRVPGVRHRRLGRCCAAGGERPVDAALLQRGDVLRVAPALGSRRTAASCRAPERSPTRARSPASRCP